MKTEPKGRRKNEKKEKTGRRSEKKKNKRGRGKSESDLLISENAEASSRSCQAGSKQKALRRDEILFHQGRGKKWRVERAFVTPRFRGSQESPRRARGKELENLRRQTRRVSAPAPVNRQRRTFTR